MQFKGNGEKDFEVLARLGHHESRVIKSSFSDLLPRDVNDSEAKILLKKPSEDEILEKARETQEAFDKILAKNQSLNSSIGNVSSSMVKFVPKGSSDESEAKFVKIYEIAKDPFDPPKFSHKRAPKPPPSPPPPVLHSPPRKVSSQEQKNWTIPPCISNWKNSKGYTIALDKRLAADGRGLRENQINENFSSFAESLYLAESHAREEIEKRSLIEKKLLEKERIEKEETLRALAAKAREEKFAVANEISRHCKIENEIEIEGNTNRNRNRNREQEHKQEQEHDHHDKFGKLTVHGATANLSIKEREGLRREMAKAGEKEIRIGRMGAEQRAKYLERIENRDISEKIALNGVNSVGSVSGGSGGVEMLFDQRLFDQTAGISQGLGDEDSYNIYDKALFGGSSVHLIYRPGVTGTDAFSDNEDTLKYPTATKKSKTFMGAEGGGRPEGPVEFEKDEQSEIDPFGLDSFLSAAKKKHNH